MAIASGAAALAIASAAGGAMSAGDHPAAHDSQPLVAATSGAPASSTHLATLQGVTPQIQAGHAAPAAATPQPPAKTAAPPTKVAWQFAQAFVGYEVGDSSKKTDAAFAATATKPLVKSLAADPPRLPSNGKVPQARVLNVVLGTAAKNQVTAKRLARADAGDQRAAADPDEDRRRVARRPGPRLMGRIRSRHSRRRSWARQSPPREPPRRPPPTRRRRPPRLTRLPPLPPSRRAARHPPAASVARPEDKAQAAGQAQARAEPSEDRRHQAGRR